MLGDKVSKIIYEVIFNGCKLLLTFSFLYNVKLSQPTYFQSYVFSMGVVGFLSPFVNYYAIFKSKNTRSYLSIINTQIKYALILSLLFSIFFIRSVIPAILFIGLISAAVRSEQALVYNNKKNLFNLSSALIYLFFAIYYCLSKDSRFYLILSGQLLVDILGYFMVTKILTKKRKKIHFKFNSKISIFNLLSGMPSLGLSYISSLNFDTSFIFTIVDKCRSVILLSGEIISNVEKHSRFNFIQNTFIYLIFVCAISIYCLVYSIIERQGFIVVPICLISFIAYTKVFNHIRFNSNTRVLFNYQILHFIFYTLVGLLMWADKFWVYLILLQPLISALIYLSVNKSLQLKSKYINI